VIVVKRNFVSNFTAISRGEQVTFRWDDDICH